MSAHLAERNSIILTWELLGVPDVAWYYLDGVIGQLQVHLNSISDEDEGKRRSVGHLLLRYISTRCGGGTLRQP